MTFTNPLAWGLLLLAVPIILFFFFKVRFRKESVTTTLFWQKVFEERRTRKIRSQFRSILSLLLALLFLALLTAAVLDPIHPPAQQNRCVMIIDNSASMNALLAHVKTTRLDTAKYQAGKQLNKLLANQQVAIITANVYPNIVSGFTDHVSALRQTLANIPATDFPADLPAALQLAEQLLADQPDATIYVYTNKHLPSPKSNVHIVPIGTPIDNLAITRFQPRRLPEQVTDYEIFVEVVNFGTETVHTQIEIDCDGDIVDVLPLSLEPNKPVTKIVRNASADGGLFRATLTDTDLFPTDSTAVAFLSKQFVQRVLLYGKENFFLRHVLQAQPQTEVIAIEDIPDAIPPDSVLVCHQTIPQTVPPGNALIIDPQSDGDLFRIGDPLELPMVANVDAENSLVRFIQPGLLFAGARMIIPQKNSLMVLAATTDNCPLYVQFISENQRTLVLTADLNQRDFSLRTAFPILISQALTHFRNSDDLQKAYSTGEPVTLTLRTEKTQIILRSPSGREEIFPCKNGEATLGKLGECGVWTVREPESSRELAQVACNLFNKAESNLRSVANVPRQSEAELGAFFVQPIWQYLALLALFLTAAEWWLYQRRWVE